MKKTMSGLVFLLQLQDLRSCNCLTEEDHNLRQCAASSIRNQPTANTTVTDMFSKFIAINEGNYDFPLSSHEEAFAFNQRLRRMPLQMELHLRILTELYSASLDMNTAFDIIFECMFKQETLILYNWFGTNKLRSFRNFGAITDLLVLSAQKNEPKFNMLRLQKLFTHHVATLQRKHKKATKLHELFKGDVNDFHTYYEIRYLGEELYPIVLTSSEDELI